MYEVIISRNRAIKSVTRDGSTIKSIFIVINQREREILVDRNAVDFSIGKKKYL